MEGRVGTQADGYGDSRLSHSHGPDDPGLAGESQGHPGRDPTGQTLSWGVTSSDLGFRKGQRSPISPLILKGFLFSYRTLSF